MKKIIYSLILLALLFGAFSILAQDSNLPSPGILPDSPFYFLKIWKEAIQNFFTFGAENKAKQYLHLADVRLAEYQKMTEKGKTEIAQKTLDKYEKQLNHALQKIEELKQKGEDTKSISQKAEDTINKHIEVLERNLQKAPEAAKKGLENAIENSSKVIEKAGGKTKKEKSCLDSGGTVTTASCCQTVSDFPNTCLIGACGCSLENSHQVKTCDCGEGKCFNGNKCVVQSTEESNVGVKIGNWVRYSVYQTGTHGAELTNPEIFKKIEVTEVSGTEITEVTTSYYKDGNAVTTMPRTVDVSSNPYLEDFIAPNLNIGDLLFHSPDVASKKVTQIMTRNYNGVDREVIYYKDSFGLQVYFDRKTGFLLEKNKTDSFGVINNFKLESTNLW